MLAQRMIRAMGFDRLVEHSLERCLSLNDPTKDFQASPAIFGGISPQSAYWPEVVAIYTTYRRQTCSVHPGADEFAEDLARRMPLDQLRSSLVFAESPTGKAFFQTLFGSLKESADTSLAKQAEVQREAEQVYREALRPLIAKYHAEPR
ncbi:MAG: hypothetical protein ACXWKJ_21180 [Telluria sp.]